MSAPDPTEDTPRVRLECGFNTPSQHFRFKQLQRSG